jgi:CRP/FNR family transcriptional regulator, cyclic AMP receptor protein
MSSLVTLAALQPTRTLAPGEVLIAEGAAGGSLYMLESGRLTVERDGVTLVTISQPNALVGEMAVLLGRRSTATVRAENQAVVRTIADAGQQLRQDGELSFAIAALLAARLEATSALVVELSKRNSGTADHGLFARIFSALTQPPEDGSYVTRHDLF